MGRFRIAAALFLLLAGELALARPGGAQGVRQLVRAVDSALAGMAQAAGDPKNPKLAPFWSALDAMRFRVSRIEEALARRDGQFFLLVDQGSSDLGALRVAWARTGVKNEPVAEGLRLASASYRMLRATYGREGIRQRQGGSLSEAERRQFQRLQRAQQRFAADLQRLRDQARRRGDAATVAELDRFHAEAVRIAWAPLDLNSYLNALIATSEMRGEWNADAPYVKKTAPSKEWVRADQTVEDLYVDSDIGQVFLVDLGKPGDEGSPDQETEAPAEVKGEVQVYQLADGEAEAPAEVVVYGPAVDQEEGDSEPAEGVEAGPEAEEEGIAEEELAEAPAAEAAEAAPPSEETVEKSETASAAAKDPNKDSGPVQGKPATPPADPHPKSPPIG
jgi:hypothetical protein